jgi:GAF domain-containing protein
MTPNSSQGDDLRTPRRWNDHSGEPVVPVHRVESAVANSARTRTLERLVQLLAHFMRESDEAAVWSLLVREAANIMGGWTAFAYVGSAGDVQTLHPTESVVGPLPETITGVSWSRFTIAAFSTRELPSADPDLTSLRPILDRHGVQCIACVAVGGRGLFLVCERRRDRVFSADDWTLSQTIAGHADAALERLQLRKALLDRSNAMVPAHAARAPRRGGRIGKTRNADP